MNQQHLLHAIQDCDNGNIPFNNGETRAFLFKNKWYPLRGVVNHAKHLAGESELTTDRALVEFLYLGFYARVSDIQFQDGLPVPLGNDEKLREVKKLSSFIKSLVE